MKKIISMILVGGKGTRLGDMTKGKAKPAISFGGKYRLIDFTLSNLSHSHIDVCGLVTQYEPMDLMNYIGNGSSWDLDYTDGGIRFLTPYLKKDAIEWQKGTGHAVKQFFDFIDHYQSQYVLILPGDHIYKMDYNKMIQAIDEDQSDILVASTRLNQSDLYRFGIVETDPSGHLLSFTEKPNHPSSNLVSMGIYIFKTEVLKSLLFSEKDLLDFGSDIIPEAIHQNYKILSYEFKGYWRDVGTLESLYEANMDMLNDEHFLGLNSSKNLPIFSRSLNLDPHIVLNDGLVQSSVIADACLINGHVIHSTLAYQVHMKKNSLVKDCVILSGVEIGYKAHIEKAIINEGVKIPDHYHSINEHCILITEDNLFKVGEIRE
ncbi:NTP transferase domain-containing protein [Hujiaoplasma nucleasis]|uniref:NTP transferase domain-containing protein n=1 Tax=Hujiaoplasma nucleasis TaxID=2725268 RepID=A0A7L6N472_9MOLU|nr:sugar phosphate nucleotidyltransferase [Hujiaoplasma nucleasis]QLY40028.1 NTP transferase domain-containing protein [Hujiaoplasma nucleasis]